MIKYEDLKDDHQRIIMFMAFSYITPFKVKIEILDVYAHAYVESKRILEVGEGKLYETNSQLMKELLTDGSYENYEDDFLLEDYNKNTRPYRGE